MADETNNETNNNNPTPGDRPPTIFDLLGKGSAHVHVSALGADPADGTVDLWNVRLDLSASIQSDGEAKALNRMFPAADVYYRRACHDDPEKFELRRKAADPIRLTVYGQELGGTLVHVDFKASKRQAVVVARVDVAHISLATLTALQSKHRANAAAEVTWENDQMDLFEDLATSYKAVGGEELPAEKGDE